MHTGSFTARWVLICFNRSKQTIGQKSWMHGPNARWKCTINEGRQLNFVDLMHGPNDTVSWFMEWVILVHWEWPSLEIMIKHREFKARVQWHLKARARISRFWVGHSKESFTHEVSKGSRKGGWLGRRQKWSSDFEGSLEMTKKWVTPDKPLTCPWSLITQ